MSGILRLAASSATRTVLKPSAGLIRSAGIHRHALQQPNRLAPMSSSKLFSRPSKGALFPASSMAHQRASYHDDGAYGYRVPKVYSMPDCKSMSAGKDILFGSPRCDNRTIMVDEDPSLCF